MEYLDPATSGPNPINKTTFLQIANSLSPEPERLLKQQIGLNKGTLLEALTGVKRAHNKTDQNLDVEQTKLKKQKIDDGAD